MIQSVKFQNEFGITQETILANPWNGPYAITDIGSLGPVEATINTTQFATIDGGVYNSARLGSREMTFTLVLLDDAYPSIEHARRRMYSIFQPKCEVAINVTTDLAEYVAVGHVEKVEPTIFSAQEGAVITIICEDPYWYSAEDYTVDFSAKVGGFKFPFSNEATSYNIVTENNGYAVVMDFARDEAKHSISISEKWNVLNDDGAPLNALVSSMPGIDQPYMWVYKVDNVTFAPRLKFSELKSYAQKDLDYPGSLENGVVINVRMGAGKNAIPKIRFADSIHPDKYLDVDMGQVAAKIGGDFGEGDVLSICTKDGSKYVKFTHNGVVTHVLNAVGMDPYWPKIKSGSNTITARVIGGENIAISAQLIFDVKHQGV